MTKFLVGVSSPDVSERVCGRLADRVSDDDAVFIVNSQPGRDETTSEVIEDGKDALEAGAECFTGISAETHQLIRGNEPSEDLLEFTRENDIDEIVIGVRKRSPTGKLLFGSTAQRVLLKAECPVWAIPQTVEY